MLSRKLCSKYKYYIHIALISVDCVSWKLKLCIALTFSLSRSTYPACILQTRIDLYRVSICIGEAFVRCSTIIITVPVRLHRDTFELVAQHASKRQMKRTEYTKRARKKRENYKKWDRRRKREGERGKAVVPVQHVLAEHLEARRQVGRKGAILRHADTNATRYRKYSWPGYFHRPFSVCHIVARRKTLGFPRREISSEINHASVFAKKSRSLSFLNSLASIKRTLGHLIEIEQSKERVFVRALLSI